MFRPANLETLVSEEINKDTSKSTQVQFLITMDVHEDADYGINPKRPAAKFKKGKLQL